MDASNKSLTNLACKACPIEVTTEEGEMQSIYGCLTDYPQALEWYKTSGKIWACHKNNKKACRGFLNIALKNGELIEVNERTILITEFTPLN